MLRCLQSTTEVYKREGNAFSTDYTFQHMKNGWVLGVTFCKSVEHNHDGSSNLSARPVIIQVNS